MRSRREVLIGGSAALLLPAAAPAGPLANVRRLEASLGPGGRIGLAVFDPRTRRHLAWRADERFAMCSTFKLLLSAQILHRAEHGQEKLSHPLAIPQTTLPNSPVTEAHRGGALPISTLSEAAMTRSDNSAANLLLGRVGGPAGLTRFLRAIGDGMTRLDRFETELNEGTPGDPRDTSSPQAMLATLRRLTFGPVLSPASRQQLIAWMRANQTGDEKLRKLLPPGWSVGDKTGAGGHGSNNDIALIWPKGRPASQPVFAAVFITGGPADQDALARNPIHARIGQLIAEWIA